MVHTFKVFDKNFVIDSESGSVFTVDNFALQVIEHEKKRRNGEKVLDRDTSISMHSAEKEVAMMIRENALFSLPEDFNVPEYNGEIKSMCLIVSFACDLKCAYCFAGGGDYGAGSEAKMSIGVAKKAIDFLIKSSKRIYHLEVDFFGGEPLLNMSVVKETVKYARTLEKKKNKKFRFTFTTNAYSLKEQDIDFLNCEMENIVLSIDGREEIHDLHRKTAKGEKSFSKVLEMAKKLVAKRAGEKYFVRGTFTKNNLDFTNDVLALYEMGFNNISLEPAVLDDSHPLSISKSDVEAIKKEYENLAKTLLEHRKKDKWINFFHFNIDLYDTPCEAKALRGCGAGTHYVAVAPDGKIYPCHQFVGSNKHLIGSVLQRGADKTVLQKIARHTHANAKEECKGCWARYYCGGGCVYSSIRYTGKIDTPHTLSCELMKKRVELALALASEEI